jgi:hypothetical protein
MGDTANGLLGAVIAIAATACGSGAGGLEELAGYYEAEYRGYNPDACVDGGAALPNFTHIRLEMDELLGEEVLAVRKCGGVFPDTCTEGETSRANAYFATDSGDIVATSPSAYNDDFESCNLRYSYGELLPRSGERIRFEIRYHEEEIPYQSGQCVESIAEQRGRSMPCVSFESLGGTRVMN